MLKRSFQFEFGVNFQLLEYKVQEKIHDDETRHPDTILLLPGSFPSRKGPGEHKMEGFRGRHGIKADVLLGLGLFKG